ncbi:MAG: hypothetical protein WCA94_09305 [Candidatus Acidiferrum sp.]
MQICNKNLTPLQRRSLQLMGSAMIFTVLTNFSTPGVPNPILDLFPSLSQFAVRNGHPSSLLVGSLAAFSVLPVLFAIWVAGRYLKAEPDEFIRALVVRALLWGIAVTMAGDAVAGVFINLYSRPFPIGVLNADLFFISTGIAFRLVQWSYR